MTNEVALAKLINSGDKEDNRLFMRRGTITAIGTASADIQIGGTEVLGVPFYSHLPVFIGADVDVLFDGPAPRIIGMTSALVSPYDTINYCSMGWYDGGTPISVADNTGFSAFFLADNAPSATTWKDDDVPWGWLYLYDEVADPYDPAHLSGFLAAVDGLYRITYNLEIANAAPGGMIQMEGEGVKAIGHLPVTWDSLYPLSFQRDLTIPDPMPNSTDNSYYWQASDNIPLLAGHFFEGQTIFNNSGAAYDLISFEMIVQKIANL